MVTPLRIGSRLIGPGRPCFIIAEAGVNHNGNLQTGFRLVDAARAAGADAVKFQTFEAERLVTAKAPKAEYQKKAGARGESQLSMLRRLQLSREAHAALRRYCKKRGIVFLSTPFDPESADFLNRLGVRAFKMASGELTDLAFLRHVARKGKPMIVSTGMGSLHEVRAAVDVLRRTARAGFALLHCVSDYPANPRDANLRAMNTLEREFDVAVGYSDHTPGIEVALAAAARGACILEKHLTLSRRMAGPDHRASIEPKEFARLVQGIRLVESALGNGIKAPAAAERAIARFARKSLVAARDIAAGTTLRQEWVVAMRPGTGLSPALLPELVGHRVRRDIARGTVLTAEMLS